MASQKWRGGFGHGARQYLFTVLVARVPIWRPHHRRLVGELVRWMDLGELGGHEISEILPGGYAVLGAAAMAAGVRDSHLLT